LLIRHLNCHIVKNTLLQTAFSAIITITVPNKSNHKNGTALDEDLYYAQPLAN